MQKYQLELIDDVVLKHSNLLCVLTGLNIILKVKIHKRKNYLKIITCIIGTGKDNIRK